MFARANKLNKATVDVESRSLAVSLLAAGELMGLMQSDPEEWFADSTGAELSAAEIDALLVERDDARASKDFARADGIRDKLSGLGITIEDGAGGSRWRRSG